MANALLCTGVSPNGMRSSPRGDRRCETQRQRVPPLFPRHKKKRIQKFDGGARFAANNWPRRQAPWFAARSPEQKCCTLREKFLLDLEVFGGPLAVNPSLASPIHPPGKSRGLSGSAAPRAFPDLTRNKISGRIAAQRECEPECQLQAWRGGGRLRALAKRGTSLIRKKTVPTFRDARTRHPWSQGNVRDTSRGRHSRSSTVGRKA